MNLLTKIITTIPFIATCSLSLANSSIDQTKEIGHIKFDRLDRSYIFQKINPQLNQQAIKNSIDTTDGRKFPLIISLHAGGQQAEDVFKQNNLSKLAYNNGYYFLAPNAHKGYWNDYRDVSLSGEKISHADDLAYVLTLISNLSKKYPIDQKSIFITGFSNGGYLTNLIGCRAIDSVHGTATIGATLTYKNSASCINRNLPTLMINGEDDLKTPIYGNNQPYINKVQQEITFAPFETFKNSAIKNGCSEIVNLKPLTDNPKISYSESLNCNNYKNVYYQIENMGHVIPSVSSSYKNIPPALGENSDVLKADEIIIKFFNEVIEFNKNKSTR